MLIALITIAYQRSGLLALPDLPDHVTPAMAGLDKIDSLRLVQEIIDGGIHRGGSHDHAISSASLAVHQYKRGTAEPALKMFKTAMRKDPRNLAIANDFRMHVLRSKRDWLRQHSDQNRMAPKFPHYLVNEPMRTFESIYRVHKIREVKFQLAMSYIDNMLLFPALEIKAPASVQAVEVLTDIIEAPSGDNQFYVPALYARGLNYLYRPFDLEWPEKIKAAPDAASADLAKCVAIGQKVGGGSTELKAELSLALGDAYAREGRLSKARSWWQIAKTMLPEEAFRLRVQKRLSWEDDDVRPHLERLLEKRMNNLEQPLSDMRFMWK